MKHFILLTLLISCQPAFATTPPIASGEIIGSMPRDGAKNMICTAFISAGYSLPDSIAYLDHSTLSDSTVRLYPAAFPDSVLPAFVSVNETFRTITLEPHTQLAPNTQYVFEVTAGVKDEAGQAFVPYRIAFQTGDTQLPKRISMQRTAAPPRRSPKKNTTPAFTAPTGYAAMEPARKVYLTPAEIAAAKTRETSAPTSGPAALSASTSPTPQKTQPLSPAAPKLEVAQEADNSSDEISPQPPVPTPSQPILPKALAIRVLKSQINRGQALPYEIDAPEGIEVQFIIKAQGGTIVKRGSGAVEAGFHQRSLPLSKLPPGKYRVSFKVGEDIKHHLFTVQ